MDTVLIDKNQRKNIERYLDGKQEDKSYTDRFLRFLSLSHSIVFGRFFSGRFFSKSFFASAALVSMISFITVVVVQIYFDREALSNIRFDTVQILLIVAFVLFNVCFDYFTIIQTKIFIEASISAKSILRSLVFIVSDLLVTMNTFILSFAFFVLIVVQFFVWPTEELRFARAKNVKNNVVEVEELPRYLTEFGTSEELKHLVYSDDFEGLLLAASDPSEYQSIRVRYHSTIDPRKSDVQLLLLSTISRFDVSSYGGFADVAEQDATALARIIHSNSLLVRLSRDAEPPGDEELPQVEQARLAASGRIKSGTDLSAAYTISFGQTDALEDGFPGVVLGNLEVFPLDSFVADTMSNELHRAPVAICVFDNGATTRFLLTSDTLGFLDNCPEFLTVNFVSHWALTRDFSTVGRDIKDRIVPYNTLLITSLLPTLAFYGVVILMAVATLLFSYLLRGTKRFKLYFLRAPFSITCFLLAIPMTLLGWL